MSGQRGLSWAFWNGVIAAGVGIALNIQHKKPFPSRHDR